MKIPNNERLMVTYVFDGTDCYKVTQNVLGKYILYKIINGDYQKMKTADSPLEFDKVVKKDRSK